ncbi:shikimate dehydrogenase [Pseudogracilibacillus auburnensis]|uniref:Shikimate dehydrogenase (NADP(+)) n=1 Tax=Pseudogracilibacillus auburnensis TaxID=1494959 RepID=A0A2V3VY90_9BACI|nr:shikimate dehydrogenase [Pseudogracilibacillus auburnensis]PXW86560.1 shikimate dehydrogenase [Pseudogracilibacillus auburnensis]
MTYQFGLIGYPIKHSLSPWIHGEFLKRTNLQGTYSIVEIDPNVSFEEEMRKLRSMNINGFNITVPYKEKIIDFLDDIDEQAKKIGAVNTVLCKSGKWIGYNTDGNGYVRSLRSSFRSLKEGKEKKILLLGAGGAAKGIFHALIQHGYQHVTVANRSIDKAILLIENHPQCKAITLKEAEQTTDQFDLIIQTSSVGMKPHVDQAIIHLTKLKEDAIVSDIIYQPLLTKLLKEAESLGASIHFGHTMLLYQAQYAFEIWTDKRPPMDDLDTELQNILEG